VSLPTVSDQPVLFHCCPNKSGPGLGCSVKLVATLSPSLHTGHSCMMHFFLLKGEVPPVCATCNGLLTKDFLFCSDFIEARESHFAVRSLQILFKGMSLDHIFSFLKEVKILGKLF